MKIFYSFLILFFGFTISAHCQSDITGTWEGMMDDEWLVLNIEQQGNQLCGQTYDYVVDDKGSYCRTLAQGIYNSETKRYSFIGQRFFANSGSHILMNIQLWFDGRPSTTIRGAVFERGFSGYMRISQVFTLKKVSSKPAPLPTGTEPCFPKPIPTAKATPKAPTPAPKPKVQPTPKPKVVAPKPTPKPTPKPPVQTPKPAPKPPVVNTPKPQPKVEPKPVPQIATIPIPKEKQQQVEERKNTDQGHIYFADSVINLKLYDNGEIDNDTITVLLNGKVIANRQVLGTKPIELTIPVDPNVKIYKLTLFADNLGSIPPNTALIVVYVDKKRYELRSKADLKENAVMTFEYRKE